MITAFFLFFYILTSGIIILLLSITFEGNLSTGYAWLFGIFVIPASVLTGVAMIISSLLEKNYPREFIFELIGLLIIFIIVTPLSSYIILIIKDVHPNERYGFPFQISAFISFAPAVLKMTLLMQESIERQLLTTKIAFSVAAALYMFTMIVTFFVPNE